MKFEEMQQIIADSLGIEKEMIKPDTKLKEELGADSLDLFQIVVSVEEQYDIQMPEQEIDNIVTAQDALDEVNRLLGEG